MTEESAVTDKFSLQLLLNCHHILTCKLIIWVEFGSVLAQHHFKQKREQEADFTAGQIYSKSACLCFFAVWYIFEFSDNVFISLPLFRAGWVACRTIFARCIHWHVLEAESQWHSYWWSQRNVVTRLKPLEHISPKITGDRATLTVLTSCLVWTDPCACMTGLPSSVCSSLGCRPRCPLLSTCSHWHSGTKTLCCWGWSISSRAGRAKWTHSPLLSTCRSDIQTHVWFVIVSSQLELRLKLSNFR